MPSIRVREKEKKGTKECQKDLVSMCPKVFGDSSKMVYASSSSALA